MVLGMGDFNAYVGKWIYGFKGVHWGSRNVEGKMLEFFMIRRSSVWQTCDLGKQKKGRNDFCVGWQGKNKSI